MIPRKFKAKPGQPTQKTQPHGIDPKTGEPYEPIDIPVPTREEVFGDLERAAKKDDHGAPVRGGPPPPD